MPGEQRSCHEFHEGHEAGIGEVPVAAPGQDFHGREKADAVDGGREEIAGDPEEIDGVEKEVGEGGQRDSTLGDLELQPAAQNAGAGEEGRTGKGDGCGIQSPGAGKGEEAGGDETQQGELEVAVDEAEDR